MKDVFIALLNMSISATWLIAAVMLVRLCMGKAPKWMRGVLWAMVALRLVVPFALESPISLVPSVQISAEVTAEQAQPVTDTAEPATEQAYTPPVVTIPSPNISASDPPVADIPAVDIPVADGEQGGDFEEFPITDEPVVTPDEAPKEEPEEKPAPDDGTKGVDIGFIGAVIWAIGALSLAVYCVGSYWRLKIRLMGAVRIGEGVYESEWIKSAFVLGIIKPIIYITRDLPKEEREYVIAHERVHISRFDYIFKPLGFLILALHWYNPAVWLAYILYCRDIELACDEKVIKGYTLEQVKGYSRALVACGEGHSRVLVCPIAFGEVGIKARVKNILNYKKPAFWIVVGAIALCVIVAVCFLTVRGDKETGASADSNEQTETDGTESTDGTEEPTDGTKEPTDTTDPTDDPTEPSKDPTDDPTAEPTDTTDPTEPTDKPIEPEDKDFVHPRYSYYAKDSLLTGEKVSIKDIVEVDGVPGLGMEDFGCGYRVYVESDVHNTSEVGINTEGQPFGFEFIFTHEELIHALGKVSVYENGVHPFELLYEYNEQYFERYVLVIIDRPFPGEVLQFSVDKVIKNGSELCFNIKTDVYREDKSYSSDFGQKIKVYELEKQALNGIDTVSLYAEYIEVSSGNLMPLPGVYQDPDYLVVSTENADSLPKGGVPLDFTVGFNEAGNCNDMPMWKDTVTGHVKYDSGMRNVRMKERVYSEYSNYGLDETFESIGFGDHVNEIQKYLDEKFYDDKTLFLFLNDSSRCPIDVTEVIKSGDDIYIRITFDYEKRIANDSVLLLELNREDVKDADVVYYYLDSTVGAGCSGDAHLWSDPTCTKPAACTRCGVTNGESLGHTYADATCTKPATCTVCGVTKGDIMGTNHSYSDATCTKPAACTRCGATKGEPLGHRNVIAATCTKHGKCSVCGAVMEAATGHNFVKNICVNSGCGEREVVYDNVVYGKVISSGTRYELGQLDCVVVLYNKYTLNGFGSDDQEAVIEIKFNNDLVHWEMSQVRGYVDGKLTDLGSVTLSTDGKSIIIPFVGEGEYLIDICYGDSTMPYVTTVSVIVDNWEIYWS